MGGIEAGVVIFGEFFVSLFLMHAGVGANRGWGGDLVESSVFPF